MARALVCFALALGVQGTVDFALLRDTPMQSCGTRQMLDSNTTSWTVSDSLLRWTVPAAVPGDLLSDLQASGVIPDPNFGLTFLDTTMWDGCSWTYSTTFDLQPSISAAISSGSGDILLVFDSLKLVADIRLNVRAFA